jgi:hypothetical protein
MKKKAKLKTGETFNIEQRQRQRQRTARTGAALVVFCLTFLHSPFAYVHGKKIMRGRCALCVLLAIAFFFLAVFFLKIKI